MRSSTSLAFLFCSPTVSFLSSLLHCRASPFFCFFFCPKKPPLFVYSTLFIKKRKKEGPFTLSVVWTLGSSLYPLFQAEFSASFLGHAANSLRPDFLLNFLLQKGWRVCNWNRCIAGCSMARLKCMGKERAEGKMQQLGMSNWPCGRLAGGRTFMDKEN